MELFGLDSDGNVFLARSVYVGRGRKATGPWSEAEFVSQRRMVNADGVDPVCSGEAGLLECDVAVGRNVKRMMSEMTPTARASESDGHDGGVSSDKYSKLAIIDTLTKLERVGWTSLRVRSAVGESSQCG